VAAGVLLKKFKFFFFQLIFPPSLAYVAARGLRKKFKIISFLSAFPPSLAYVAAGGLRKKSKKIFLTDFPFRECFLINFFLT